MLILTRRTNETLCIGDNADITFTILGIKGNQIKIGINAPKSIPVHRQEVFERIKQEEEKRTSEPPIFEIVELEGTMLEESSD